MKLKKKYLKIRNSALLLALCFLFTAQYSNAQYVLHVHYVDKDSAFIQPLPQLQTSFTDILTCRAYVAGLPALLATKGFATASVDSFWTTDSTAGINLFLGRQYHWIKLIPDGIEKKAMDESGFIDRNFEGKVINMAQLQGVQQRVLNYYENNGYPFAEVFLDSVRIDEDKLNAFLRARKGPLYHIDSISIFGKAKVSKNFLYHYLGIAQGAIYSKEKLDDVSRRILELPYVQEIQRGDLLMLGTGSILRLYLAPKKSSEVSAIVGFLPSATDDGKLQVTGDVRLNLKNALNTGETILLNWQQLQPKSPKLNLGYQQPYIFHSNFGFDFLFDLFKKDSSYLQLNGQLGLQYVLSAYQSGKLFVQWQNSFLLAEGVDTNAIIATKKLPPNIDVNSANVGLDYEFIKTDYRLNPRKGNELWVTTSVGIKNVKKNNEIINIKDPTFDYSSLYDSVKPKSYQFRIKIAGAHYFPVGKQGTFKTALNTAAYISPGIFRNELFQIGGYQLLRGFNEESIYATQYAVGTIEYRYRLGLNSNLFGFVDMGLVKSKYQEINTQNSFLGTGIGMAFETKFGLLNISYAVGKRDDVKFNLQESSKIHFGYINYF